MKRVTEVMVVLVGVVMTMISSASAEESISNKEDSFRAGFHAGFSSYIGCLGVEFQKRNWSFSFGFPETAGIRYYFDDKGYRWFMGAHGMVLDIDEADERDGVLYEESTSVIVGMGPGYKWRFKDHWDITLSASIFFMREKLKSATLTRTEDSVGIIPGLMVGYTF